MLIFEIIGGLIALVIEAMCDRSTSYCVKCDYHTIDREVTNLEAYEINDIKHGDCFNCGYHKR